MWMSRQIQSRSACNPALFGRRNSSRSRAELPRRSCLDLDEGESVAIQPDDIELPRPGSDVAGNNLEASLLEPTDTVGLGRSTSVMGVLLLSEPTGATHWRFQRVPVGVSSRTIPWAVSWSRISSARAKSRASRASRRSTSS